jgi:hypothetical protein
MDGSQNQELPERTDSLSNRPLVEVRSGGLNMQNDCARSPAPVSLSSAR